MKNDFIILGATGEQGSIAARDLFEQGFRVLLCGRNRKKIEKLLKKYNINEKLIAIPNIFLEYIL